MIPIAQQLETLEKIEGVEAFSDKLKGSQQYPLCADQVQILQINVGRRCNLGCKHCHVQAGPERTEAMSKEIFEQCLKAAKNNPSINTIDITGGSPEMNENLAWFLKAAAKLGKRLIVRSNLVILLEPEYKKFIDIYANNKVEIVGSMPDYHEEKSDRQRGKGFFEQSIKVLKLLNEKGYGKKGSGLIIDLVYNPVGAYLPGSQTALEQEYRARLRDQFNIEFNNLFCLTNMPIGRYLEALLRTGNYNDYMQELANAYNPSAVPNVMCRVTISVSWDGKLYDCDFNQVLDLPISGIGHINKFDADKLSKREVVIRNHCYGCTAGSGSSCQGALE